MGLDVVGLGLAKAYARSVRPPRGLAARRGLFPVADLANPPTAGQVSNGTNTCGQYRTRHDVMTAFDSLVVEFSNYRINGFSGESENAQGNDVTIRAAVEIGPVDGSGVKYPLYKDGRRDLVIGPGGWASFDPPGLAHKGLVDAYPYLWIRSVVTVPTGGVWYMNGVTATSIRPGEGNQVSTTYTDTTLTGSITSTSNWALKPSALLGTVKDWHSIVALIGDSILHGLNDSDLGFATRAFRPVGQASVKVATPGDRAVSWVNKVLSIRRRSYIAGCTHGIWEYGVNDLNGGRTLAQLQADCLTGCTEQSSINGLKMFVTTLTPWTTSTDAWATLANQTVTSWEASRVAYNTWVRAGLPIDPTTKAAVAVGTGGALVAGQLGHPVMGYFEIADRAESARNSGKWRVDAGQPTADGIHPGATVSAQMALAIDIAKLAA